MSSPIKLTIKTEIIPLFFLLLTAIAGYYFYYHFPAVVVTHWNWAGQPDGWGSGKTNAIVLPLVTLGMYILFLVLPYLDPKKERYVEFAKVYHVFKGILVSFMAIIFIITSINNLGYFVPIGKVVPAMVGLLFIVMGNYMGKLKKNWFIGVRTPWTLSSEEVWNKTHRFSGKIFILSGVLMIINGWIPSPSWSLSIFIINIAVLLIGTIGYSYWAYLQWKKGNNRN